MAASMSHRQALYRFRYLCRSVVECKRYMKTKVEPTQTKEKKEPIGEPIPWEDRPEGILILKEHPPFLFQFKDALCMHKEAAQPAMANSLHSNIYADMLLDFSTKKKTKPMKHFTDLITFPHKFDSGQEKNYMVFSESEETVELAKSLGALVSGGYELIEMMALGRVHKDDIAMTDVVLATPEIFSKMGKVRSTLKTKFPTPDFTVDEDIQALMERMNKGVHYSTDRKKVDDSHARVQIPFGQLNQDEEQLWENFDLLIQHFLHKKPESLPPLVKEAILIAPPSKERFMINMNCVERKPHFFQTTQQVVPDKTEPTEAELQDGKVIKGEESKPELAAENVTEKSIDEKSKPVVKAEDGGIEENIGGKVDEKREPNLEAKSVAEDIIGDKIDEKTEAKLEAESDKKEEISENIEQSSESDESSDSNSDSDSDEESNKKKAEKTKQVKKDAIDSEDRENS